jgi:L-asparaginase/Glu-tRNA(Gln) amidotransferase subunit D
MWSWATSKNDQRMQLVVQLVYRPDVAYGASYAGRRVESSMAFRIAVLATGGTIGGQVLGVGSGEVAPHPRQVLTVSARKGASVALTG